MASRTLSTARSRCSRIRGDTGASSLSRCARWPGRSTLEDVLIDLVAPLPHETAHGSEGELPRLQHAFSSKHPIRLAEGRAKRVPDWMASSLVLLQEVNGLRGRGRNIAAVAERIDQVPPVHEGIVQISTDHLAQKQ